MPFVWFIMAGYPCISSHPLPMLLKLEPLFPTNCPFGYHAMCSGVLMMGCLHRSTTPWSSEHRDALRCCDQASLDLPIEAVIERVCRCTWRPWSCKLGGRNQASLEIHLEAVIERVWRGTSRPWLCELGGSNRATFEIHSESVIERVWNAFGGNDRTRLEEYFGAVVQQGGATGAETLLIG